MEESTLKLQVIIDEAVKNINATANKMQDLKETAQRVSQSMTDAILGSTVALETQKEKVRQLTAEYKRLQKEREKDKVPKEKVDTLKDELTKQRAILAVQKEMLKQQKQINAEANQHTKIIARQNQLYKGIISSLRGMLVRFVSIYAILGTLKSIVRTITEFEQGMKELEAITNATGDEMLRLEKQAISLAGAYRFNAKEISELYLQLARLGFTTDEIEKSTKALLQLSTATGENLASSAQIAASVIRGLQLDAENLVHIVDVMGVGFNTSALDLARFRESIKYVLPLSKELGISFELLTALLGKLADAQIYGSLAGTSLRNLFSELANPTSQLTELIGFMVRTDEDLIKALEILNEKGLALGDIFNLVEKRATTTLSVLIDNAGGMRNYYEQMIAANGEMQRMADVVMQSLQSQMKATKNEWQAMILSMDKGEGVVSKVGKFFAAEFRDIAKDLNKNITASNTLTDVYEKFGNELDTGSARLQVLQKRYKELKSEVEYNIEANDELRYVIAEIVKLLPQAATEYDNYGNALDISLPKIQKAIEDNKAFLNVLSDFSTQNVVQDIAKSIYSIGDYREQINKLNNSVKEFQEYARLRQLLKDPTGASEAAKQVRLLDQDIKDLSARLKYEQNNLQLYISQLQQMGIEFGEIQDMVGDLDLEKILNTNLINNKMIRPYEDVIIKFRQFIKDIFDEAIQVNFELQETEKLKQQIRLEFNEAKKEAAKGGEETNDVILEAYNKISEKYTNELNRFKEEVANLQVAYNMALIGMDTFAETLDVEATRKSLERMNQLRKNTETALAYLNSIVSQTYGDIQILGDEQLRQQEALQKKLINTKYAVWESENKLSRDSLKKREQTVRLSIMKEIELLKLEQEYLKKTNPEISDEEYNTYTRLIAQKYKELTVALSDVRVNWYAEQEKLDRDYRIIELENNIKSYNTQKELIQLHYDEQLLELDKYYELRSKADGTYDKEKLILQTQLQNDLENLQIEHQNKMYQSAKSHELAMMQMPSGYYQELIDTATTSYEQNSEILYLQLNNQEITQKEYFDAVVNLYKEYYSEINELKSQQARSEEDSLEKDLDMLKIRQDMELENLKTRLETGAIEQEQFNSDLLELTDKGLAEEWKIRNEWANKILDISERTNNIEKQIRDNRIQELQLSNEAEARLLKESEMLAVKTAIDNANIFAETQKLIYGESSDEYKKALENLKLLRSELGKLLSEYDNLEEGNFLDALGITDEQTQKTIKEAYDFIKDEFIGFLGDMFDAQVEYADRQVDIYNQLIEEKQREVETETELMAEGYANMKSIREAELADLKREREEAFQVQKEALQRQERLEKSVQYINMVTAVTEIIKNAAKKLSPIAAVALAAIASAAIFEILGAYKSKAKSLTYAEGGSYVIEGKRHSQGGEVIHEGEKGERVSVFSRQATSKYDDFIVGFTDAINKNRLDLLPDLIPSLAHKAFVGDRLEFPIKTNIESIKELTSRREEVKKLDIKVSLDESSELKDIRKLLNNRLTQKQVSETSEYVIIRMGNITRRVRK